MPRAKMTLRFLLVGALLFGGGFVLGQQLSRSPRVAKMPIPAGAGREIASTHAVGKSELAAAPMAKIEPAEQSSRSMAQLRAVMEINRQATHPLFSFNLLDGGGSRLNEDFVQAFDLTPAERQELEGLIAASKMGIAQLEAKQARVESQADGGFTIVIPPFPKEGGEVYDQFVGKLESLLGPERSSYLREMQIVDSDRLFALGGFGLVQSNFRLLPPGGGNESSWGTEGDPVTGMMNRSGVFDAGGLRFQFPFLYERMRQAGQISGRPGP